MGKATGFLEFERCEDAWVPAETRIKDFNEFHTHLSEEARKCQAGRCMACGVPMCQSALRLKGMVTGCPLHNLIPEWNDEIWSGHYEHALSRLLKTSNFPEFTGRVCPALCEKACINGMNGSPVTIHDNELFLIEKGFSEGWMKPRVPALRSGKKVAVVGSGPAGLAVADQLNHRGHSVTVFEREDEIGGLLMYGIPNMKLDKKVIVRRRKLMEAEGVTFKTGCDIGKDISFQDLREQFDAVALCCGAKKPRDLNLENRESCREIHFAVDFLKSATRDLLSGSPDWTISARDLNVVIVGGGDTGNDCLGTCIRQGAKNVVQLEMLPKPPVERAPDNPWPEWPKVLKTDYGQQEAIAVFGADPRVYETTVKELVLEEGKLKAIKTVQVKFENRALAEVPDTVKEIPCDLLIIAAGFLGCEDYVANDSSVDLTKRNTVATQENSYETSVPGVFTAGDMHRGQSLVVWAISEGRHCAAEIDKFLMGYTSLT
ncbi:glutamate synthase subunit beta [Succinimonas sp.]|uniref:glutamate synthase subunit beta n=1 Tax=Succinimonas sp. TaxID=1936151 RepID=UPI002E87B2EF|nr:glutamate synthase subunit beta [Succinimonas sp.]